jgi:hypothetical protein
LVELVLGASAGEDTLSVESAIAKVKALQMAIESFPKGEYQGQPRAKSLKVHRYECCRLIAIVMTRAVSRGVTWSDAASWATFEEDIIFSLSNSDTEDLWGEHVGLLYWVSLVTYAVLHKTRQRLFGAGLIHRLISEVTFGDQDPRIGVDSLMRIGRFEEKCTSGVLRYCCSTSPSANA